MFGQGKKEQISLATSNLLLCPLIEVYVFNFHNCFALFQIYFCHFYYCKILKISVVSYCLPIVMTPFSTSKYLIHCYFVCFLYLRISLPEGMGLILWFIVSADSCTGRPVCLYFSCSLILKSLVDLNVGERWGPRMVLSREDLNFLLPWAGHAVPASWRGLCFCFSPSWLLACDLR